MIKKLSGKEYPLAAKTVPLGSRRKSRRPQHAPLAYAGMTNFTSLAEIDDEAEFVIMKMKILELKNQNLQLMFRLFLQFQKIFLQLLT
jgi:hypothetical protein